ncbi:MAG TPA: transglutaminase-like domain-containing protein [Verrucomicrobiae bacterium]|nr:transglutaminase-like domain-containing protein [Verrucomicrobiae bacterium]
METASRLESQGRFGESAATLTAALQNTSLTAAQRAQLEFELDRLHRIKLDYPLTESALFEELKNSVNDLTREEFENWVREGRFDTREIDGRRYFMAASVSNLFFRYQELAPRRRPARNSAAVEKHHLEVCAEIKREALARHQPYVLPKRFEVTMTVSADADAAPDGETIRAWLPIPRRYPFQGGFSLVSGTPAAQQIDSEDSTARSIYFEQVAHRGKPTEFKAQYQYTARGVWFDLKPEEVRPYDPNQPGLREFMGEGPHIQFTPEIRALSERISGAETNVCLKAKRFYEWIAENIKYSTATEYSTIRNISEYCRSHGYGDCGQEGLLFMTLCRLNGIPARWQSGWTIFPGAKSNHDWTEIYLAPYGWVPVDPYMGIYATRYATTLTPAERLELRDFYFGGLDQYRLIANSDHNQALHPAKRTMRSDDVDFQRGELEWGDHNLYFDQFSYELTARELEPPRGKVE